MAGDAFQERSGQTRITLGVSARAAASRHLRSFLVQPPPVGSVCTAQTRQTLVVCVYVFVCVVCVGVYMHVYTCMHVCVRMYVCMYVCVHVSMCMYTCCGCASVYVV